MSEFLGIARERVYSPGKVEDDLAILAAVADLLSARHTVRMASAEDSLPDPEPGTIVFTMCQGPPALRTMRRWEAAGIRVVNSAAAIENCHRHRMQAALHAAGVKCPPGAIIPVNGVATVPKWITEGAWLKRGDVHATQAGDVVFVRRIAEVDAALRDFRARGIRRALVQRHVPGTVIKFYAVRHAFLAWFPAEPLALSAAEVDKLNSLANRGAEALGLEIFGGDCVRAEDGSLWLIDLNDWPSYGRCRVAAAQAIAEYLGQQASGQGSENSRRTNCLLKLRGSKSV